VPDISTDAGLDGAFKALASSQRRSLLKIVASRTAGAACCSDADEVCACELAEALELAPSTISHHMGALVRAGLVTARKKGLWVYYKVDRDTIALVARELGAL
jgi:ArsR family transcriptional regulator